MKLYCDELLSSFAFTFNVRRYNVGFSLDGGRHIALRCDEYYYTVYSSAASKALSFAFFDIRATSQLQAGLNSLYLFLH